MCLDKTKVMFCNKDQKTSIKADRKSRAANTNKVHIYFCWGKLRKTDNLENPGIDGRIIMDWIDLVQEMNRWRALVNAAMDLRVP